MASAGGQRGADVVRRVRRGPGTRPAAGQLAVGRCARRSELFVLDATSESEPISSGTVQLSVVGTIDGRTRDDQGPIMTINEHDQMPMSLDQGPRGPLCRRVAARLRSSITSGGREISSRVPGCRPSARAGSLAAERLPGLPDARRQHHDFESLSKGKNGRLDRATRTVRTGSERPGSCCSRKCAGHTALRRRTAPFPARAGTPPAAVHSHGVITLRKLLARAPCL